MRRWEICDNILDSMWDLEVWGGGGGTYLRLGIYEFRGTFYGVSSEN